MKEAMKNEPVSILLPVRGRHEFSPVMLHSLSRTLGKELIDLIIVVDDDKESVDICSREIKKNEFRSVNIILSPKRLFSVKAFNVALEHCNTEKFIWLSNSLTFSPNWFQNTVSEFTSLFPDDIGVLAIGGKINKANFGITSKRFIDYNENEWFNPVYKINFCDDELAARALLLGRFHVSSSRLITINDFVIKNELLFSSLKEKKSIKIQDRANFYRRSEYNFFLPDWKTYEWTGFCNKNLPLKG